MPPYKSKDVDDDDDHVNGKIGFVVLCVTVSKRCMTLCQKRRKLLRNKKLCKKKRKVYLATEPLLNSFRSHITSLVFSIHRFYLNKVTNHLDFS